MMNPHLLPLHMVYAELLRRLGVRNIFVFNVSTSELRI